MRAFALTLALVGHVGIASAEAQAPRPPPAPELEARDALFAARAQCKKRGPALTAFVGRTFDTPYVAAAVIDDWDELDVKRRAIFVGLLDRAIGREQRAIATGIVCRQTPFASVVAAAPNVVHLRLTDEDCTTLVVERIGGRWAMTGVLYCGQNAYYGDLREWLGGGDIDKAIETLTSRTRTPA